MDKKIVVILGSKGMLGQELVREFGDEKYIVHALDRDECDVTQVGSVEQMFETLKPTLVINAVAHNGVDDIEKDTHVYETAQKLNGQIPGMLAELCKKHGAVLVHYSTDYVFSGDNKDGYDENAVPQPISKYGETKLAGEGSVMENGSSYYIIRLSRLFGKVGTGVGVKKSFVDTMLSLVREAKKTSLDIVDEEMSSPTYAPDLARFTRELIEDTPPFGIYHAANSGACTWYGFAQKIFELGGLSPQLNPVSSDKFPRPAKRPAYSVLLNTKRPQQRSWEEALKDYLN